MLSPVWCDDEPADNLNQKQFFLMRFSVSGATIRAKSGLSALETVAGDTWADLAISLIVVIIIPSNKYVN